MSADGGGFFASAPSPEELARFPRNDLGNARRLLRMVGGQIGEDGRVDASGAVLLYLRKRGWIAYQNGRWDLEAGEEEARRWTHRVAEGLFGQAGDAQRLTGCSAKDWYGFVEKSGSSGSSAAMLAQAVSYLSVDLNAFDKDPLALNTRGGTLKFRREGDGRWGVKMHPHDASDRITRMCGAAWDPHASAARFEDLVAFCQPRQDMREYLQALLGYVATGSTKEQLFVILQGKGGDGKSTLVNAVREALGDYSVGAAVETFLDTGIRRSSEASPDLARLAGDTRMICTAEPPRGSKLASSAIKSFTGGGTVQARELRQGIFEFQPIGKVVLECNGRPQINDADDGIWRRVRILMFENQVAREAMDKDLPETLKGESAGILRWLVEGVLLWLEKGLKTPEPVEAALEDYRRGSNPFAQWLADRVIIDKDAKARSSDLYTSYKEYCEAEGHERPMSQTTFGRALGDMQIILAGKDGAGKKQRRGARLRDARDDVAAEVSPGGPSGGEAPAFSGGQREIGDDGWPDTEWPE